MDDKMNLSEKDDPKKGAKGGAGKVFFRKKVCRFCMNGAKADYKDPETLKRSVTERGKILQKSPRFGLSAFRKKIIE